ncbi:MAG TPA: hypothetical protein DEF79_09340 [Gammaproteobacteria bacterium]|nr:hypothetical protein [Gammaproteobacteria bacterium]
MLFSTAPSRDYDHQRNRTGLILSTSATLLLCTYLFSYLGWRQASLFLVGLVAGVILYRAAFGFTAAWREVALTGRSAGLRAQMIMLGTTVIIFTPLIAQGDLFGIPIRGSIAPVNLAVLCGAFIFGIGMQLGGGCASGTLFTAGAGNLRMLVTLAGFIAGSVIGTYYWQNWQGLPGFNPIALSDQLGVPGGILTSLILLIAVYLTAATNEKRKHGDVVATTNVTSPSLLRGPWPLLAGALALAFVNVATLMLAGRPWGVTASFALWGAKMLNTIGIDVSHWAYWTRPALNATLNTSVFHDVSSVMNFGIVLGALLAASLSNEFSPSFRIPARALLAAVLGGLLLGFGARIAYGCNIGAYFGGISSTSLHGWLWFAAAFAGSSVGTKLRPWFGLR